MTVSIISISYYPFQFEELHSKEELSKVLQNLADCGDDVDPANSQGSPIVVDPDTIIRVSRILRKLNSSGKVTMATNKTGTEVASSATLVRIEEPCEKTCFFHMRKQRHRSAVQSPAAQLISTFVCTISLLPEFEISSL